MVKKEGIILSAVLLLAPLFALAGNQTANFGLHRYVIGDIDWVSQQNTNMNTLEANLDASSSTLTELSISTQANALNISTNGVAIALNQVDIASNLTNISTNGVAIAVNITDIATNVTDIASNLVNITTNGVAIAVNQADIATNVTDIASNLINISTNGVAIAVNITDIATNVTDIGTNVTDIASNLINISTDGVAIASLDNLKYDKTGGAISGSVTIEASATIKGAGRFEENVELYKNGYLTLGGTVVSNTLAHRFIITGRKAKAGLAPVGPGDYLLSVIGQGWDGSGYDTSPQIEIFASETWDATSHGSYINFNTVQNGGTAIGTRMRITNNGSIGINIIDPTAKLDVNGDGVFRGHLGGTSSGTIKENFRVGGTMSVGTFYSTGTAVFGGDVIGLSLDEVESPATDVTFAMANKTVTWNFTNPSGGMIWNFTGNASDHSLRINQSGGNPAGDMHLLHLETSDPDPQLLHLESAGGHIFVANGGPFTMTSGSMTVSGNIKSGGTISSMDMYSSGTVTALEFIGPLTGNADTASLASQATQLAATTPCPDGFVSRGMEVGGLAICVEVLDAEVDGSSLPVSGKALFDHDATADAHHIATTDTGPIPDCTGTQLQAADGSCPAQSAVGVDTFVTNKDTHDHLGGDGAEIQHTSLGTVGISDHHAATVAGDIAHDSTTGGTTDDAHHAKAVSGDITHDSTTGGTTDDAHFDHADDLAELNTQIGSGLVTGSHTSDTNAGTICAGTTVYLDGEGNCDTIEGGGVGADDATVFTSTNTFEETIVQGNSTTGMAVAQGTSINALSVDGATQGPGCWVVMDYNATSDDGIMVFTSTTTNGTTRPGGVLLESCDPGEVCKVQVSGIAKHNCNSASVMFSQGPGTSTTRCRAQNVTLTHNANNGRSLRKTGTTCWSWLRVR